MTIKDIIGYFSPKAKEPTQQITIVDKKVTVAQLDRTRKDIRKWRQALEAAESPYYPMRTELIEVYEEIVIDAYLSEAMKKRVRRVRNTPAVVFDKNGERDEEKTKLFKTTWFQDFVAGVVESEFWGFSLMELKVEKGQIADCLMIPRLMVHPEYHQVSTYAPGDGTGINYYEKPYINFLIFAGKERELGLLNKLAPYAIYKRATLVDWAEHSELFGMPIRVYEYDPQQPTARAEAEASARQAGSAAYIVVPKGTGLTLEGGDGTAKPDMYNEFRKALNEEMLIAVLGQTMTTESGSSRAQAEVHESTEADILADDLFRVQIFANNQLIPRLVRFGVLAEGDTIVFDKSEKLSISEQLDMDIKLCEVIDVPQSYLFDKYNVPYPVGKEATAHRKQAQNALPTAGKEKLADDTLFFLNDFDLQATFDRYQRAFIEALRKDFTPNFSTESGDIFIRLQRNAIEFACAKAYAMADAKGNPAMQEKIKGYTQTEKDLYTQAGQMGRKWAEIQETKDILPYLQYDALNDSRVRPEHLALDGVVRRADDGFWLTQYPPNGYNCRCTVRQIAQATETSDSELASRQAQDGGKPAKGFDTNVGITGEAVTNQNSYFKNRTEAQTKQQQETALPTLFKEHLHAIETDIAEKELEHVFVLDADAKLIYKNIGTPDTVDLIEQYEGQFKRSVVTHNHPSKIELPEGYQTRGVSFSEKDLAKAFAHELSEIRATNDGNVFSLRTKTNTFDFDKYFKFIDDYSEIKRIFDDQYKELVTKRVINEEQREMLLQDLILQKLTEKYSLTYKHEKI